MRLTVFGATGETGRQLLEQALRDGHDVVALARDPGRLPAHEKLRPVRGDVRDPAAVRQAIDGGDAVLSALGQRGLRHVTVCADGMRAILPAMTALGVGRLIAVSGYGVADSRGNLYSAIAWTTIRAIMRDKEAMEELIRTSTADWTIVRPAILTSGSLTSAYQAGTDLRLTPASRISRADVAHLMLSALADQQSVHRALAIGPSRSRPADTGQEPPARLGPTSGQQRTSPRPAWRRKWWASRACTAGVQGPAAQRTVSPARTAPPVFPPSSCLSATRKCWAVSSRRPDEPGREADRRAFPDGCVEEHVPAVAADFLVAAQQALALEPGSLGGLD